MGKRKKRNQDPAGKTNNAAEESKEKFAIDDLLVKVEACLENFNFELAEKFADRAIEMSPDHQQALTLAASVFLETGKVAKAVDCLKHAIEIEPEKGSSKYMTLGQLLEGEEAVVFFQKGIQLMMAEKQTDDKENNVKGDKATTESNEITDRDISNAYCSLAEIFLTDCCFAENAETSCKEYCEKAIEQDPDNPDACQVMANFLLSKEKNEEAKQMLLKSFALWRTRDDQSLQGPQLSYESRISLSKMLIEVREFDSACNVLEELLQEDDEVVQVWYLLGWLHYLTEQGSDTVKHYLTSAKKLFVLMECDDEPMLEHIDELLSEIIDKDDEENGGIAHDDNDNDGEEKVEDEEHNDEDKMDTTT